ncbi:putative homeobox protein meis [Aspergillus bombycis]|uniref:Putative homeobox protein meis n=1 Tax=Aspergillus bombycis TaxID=109264 RepID=A0A1F8AI18_9EURO|nr:putative homeobox protein meis [Aspergillus bombycis]OGM50948.1 putative homeobox protein meis [Aspergillus bombycis]
MEHAHNDTPHYYEDVLLLPPLSSNDALVSEIDYRLFQEEILAHSGRPSSHGSFNELQPEVASQGSSIQSHLPTELLGPYGDLNYAYQNPLSEDFPDLPTFDHSGLSDRVASDVLSERHSHMSSSCESLQLEPSVSTNIRSSSRRWARRKNRRFSTTAVSIMRSWLNQHQDYPYPTEQEKEQLKCETGLDVTQISNWFTNARRRRVVGSKLTTETHHADNSLLSPLERWQNSPPESEPAETCDILRALEDIPYTSDGNVTYPAHRDAVSSNSSSASFVVGVPSISSYEHSQSSSSDISLNRSNRPSQRPPTPVVNIRPRRRRRKPPHPNEAKNKRNSKGQRPYQCTFCSDTFNTKYDWQRHEKALHLPVDRWACAPQGGLIEVDGTRVCVFCQAPDVDCDHLETHDYLACREKSSEQRTFTRKDHLRQHLKLTHYVDYHPSMEQWRESLTHIKSRCGFCNARFDTWPERVDHVADHFKKGADMVQWKGCWGFEPGVTKLVENAMPPYLVGHERQTMDPWKTTDALDTGGNEVLPFINDIPNALSRYVNLRRDLIVYLREQAAVGNHITDQMVQDKAREIAYGSNDPFDQTYADNPKWVTSLRQEAALMSISEANCLFPYCDDPPPQDLAARNDVSQPPFSELGLIWDNLLLAEDTPLV